MRDRFVRPEGIYLAGNSLGALPFGVAEAVADTIRHDWADHLVAGWNDRDWWTLPGRVGDQIAPLIGAGPGQVICGDSTSIQLFQALVGMLRLRPGPTPVVIDAVDFPTDRYVADAAARLVGTRIERADPDAFGPPAGPVVALFSAVDFATGAQRDLAAVTEAVHAAGGLVVWDLSHAAGAIPLQLDGLGADAAVGCTYKYLCGGPGSPAYIYLPHRHQSAFAPAIPGWQGHADPFGLAERYLPADGIERARIGTPPILSMIAVSRALDVWNGVAMADVRAKSLALTDLAIAYADAHLRPFGVEVVTPRPHDRRGSQVSLRVADAYPLSRALIARGVTGDFRAPDVLRLGMAPLYLSHAEVWDAMGILGDILATDAHHDPALTCGRQPTT